MDLPSKGCLTFSDEILNSIFPATDVSVCEDEPTHGLNAPFSRCKAKCVCSKPEQWDNKTSMKRGSGWKADVVSAIFIQQERDAVRHISDPFNRRYK